MTWKPNISIDEIKLAQMTAGPVAIVISDIVGSTEMRRRLGDVLMGALTAKHFAWLAAHIRNHNGIYIKDLGDGVMAVFPDVLEAVKFAREVERDPGDPSIAIRVAVHRGDVEARGLDIDGVEISYTTRVLSACKEGGVMISGAVKQHLERLYGTGAGLLNVVAKVVTLKGFGRGEVFKLVALNPLGGSRSEPEGWAVARERARGSSGQTSRTGPKAQKKGGGGQGGGGQGGGATTKPIVTGTDPPIETGANGGFGSVFRWALARVARAIMDA